MRRRIRSGYRKFVRFNLWATLYGSSAMGLFPFIYISRERKLQCSKWLIGYGIVFNTAMLGITFFVYEKSDSIELQEMFQRNPLSEQIYNLHNILLLILVFVMYFRNWWLSAELANILNNLLNIHHYHLGKYDSNDCSNFDKFIIYRGSSIVLELVSMIALTISRTPEYNLKLFLGLTSFLVIHSGVLLIGMHFNLAVLYIYRSVWIINRKLLEFVDSSTNSPSIHHLHSIYSRLLELNSRLVGIYDYQMTLLMISLLSVNIVYVFYMIVYSISLKKTITFGVAINSLQVLLINLLDFWLNIAVCELGERASQETSEILKLFNDIPGMDINLERSVADFALFCSHERIKFNHCGLFTIQNAMGFRMIITSGLYLLYLVQFDFMNL